MNVPALRGASYPDILAAPENMVAELVGGDLYLQPRPAAPHAEAASVLGMIVGPPFRLGQGGPGGWVIQDEPELHFGADVLVPDLAGWVRADHPELDLSVAFFERAPNWVCEVLSPSTRGHDRVRKLPIYAAAGVGYSWLVDPLARTIEVFESRDGLWTLLVTLEGGVVARAKPFDAVELDVSPMWAGADDVERRDR